MAGWTRDTGEERGRRKEKVEQMGENKQKGEQRRVQGEGRVEKATWGTSQRKDTRTKKS